MALIPVKCVRYARSGLCCGSHLANHSRAGEECSASSGESGRQSPIRQISSLSVSGAGVTLKLTSQPGASLTESPLSFLHHWGNEPMVPTREAPSVVHPIAERAGRLVGKSTFAPPCPCTTAGLMYPAITWVAWKIESPGSTLVSTTPGSITNAGRAPCSKAARDLVCGP